nr:AAA family ATPase [uncultured Oscillibacter sp.]
MKFAVYDKGSYPTQGKELFYFYRDNWDDYSYKTSFVAYYYDSKGMLIEIGPVKIGYVGMERGAVYDTIPKKFAALPETFFSLGQSDEYYEHLKKLGHSVREHILVALNDIAYDLDRFEKVANENVVRISLLRDVSKVSVKYQFNRIAHGGVRLTNWKFKYSSPLPETEDIFSSIDLTFSVNPNLNPPSNIHVLIGRNGTGKTRLLQNMIRSIRFDTAEFGTFGYSHPGGYAGRDQFANILCVAFSPFDDFSCTLEGESEIPYTYIGLDKTSSNLIEAIKDQFWDSFMRCMSNSSKKQRWINTVQILKSDPAFEKSRIDFFTQVFEEGFKLESTKKTAELQIRNTFSELSSGHKVTLLIITSCVDKLVERSIVFMDEPENHLHPPLLSAFVRAFSYLLTERNGVAVISTHSPVILQEVPHNCVWALRRQEHNLIAERLPIETFGSNIGLLTSQVFGLEVTESGFHKLISDAVEKYGDYDQIVKAFQESLGEEAKGILRTLLALKERRG